MSKRTRGPLDRMKQHKMEKLALVYLAQRMRETGLRHGTSVRDDVRRALRVAGVSEDNTDFFCQSLTQDLMKEKISRTG